MRSYFPNLAFHDTHTINYIAYPQKPDVTVTLANLCAHVQTALAVVELKRPGKSIDDSAKGQVCSAVNLIFNKLVEKRPIWGFVVNGEKHNNFIYQKLPKGNQSLVIWLGKLICFLKEISNLLTQWTLQLSFIIFPSLRL
jgi:hypothetical protein